MQKQTNKQKTQKTKQNHTQKTESPKQNMAVNKQTVKMTPIYSMRAETRNRALSCSTSAGNMYIGQLKYFDTLHMSTSIDLGLTN